MRKLLKTNAYEKLVILAACLVVAASAMFAAFPDAGAVMRMEATAPAGDGVEFRVNINAASAALLEELPGIGPVIAARIIEYRESFGPFEQTGQLMQVKGIGPKIYGDLENFICV